MAESVSFALAEKLGSAEAHELVAELARQAAKTGGPFRELVESDKVTAHISAPDLVRLFMPTTIRAGRRPSSTGWLRRHRAARSGAAAA